MKIRRLFYIFNRRKRFLWLAAKGMFKTMDDRKYLEKLYYAKLGKKLNIDAPHTFNEKLQWLKLNDRNPLYTTMVDKYEVKEWIAERIGEEHIIPTLGLYNDFDEIDFDALPEQFVMKCTQDSGGVVIVKDKADFNKKDAEKKLKRALKRDYYLWAREWPYKNVPRRIIVEKYIENDTGEELVEYKIFCFNGEARMVLVCKGQAHGIGRTNDFCDTNLERFPFTSFNPNSTGKITKPKQLPEMLQMAEKLSIGVPQLRVDFYICNNNIYIGELTFFHNAGLCKFEPEEWDRTLGDWIKLPQKGEK